jgi:dienelactone hydrolase
MHVIIVTDIFGLTLAIQKLAHTFNQHKNIIVTIVDPYKGVKKSFIDEREAYQTFIVETGHQQYTDEVKKVKNLIDDDIFVLGFSAGASAAWKSAEHNLNALTHVIGFYPSQIRNQLNVIPCCPVTMIFPKTEPHFDINQTIKALSKIDNISCFKTRYQHGFINPLSINHSAEAEQYFLMKMSKIAKKLNELMIINELKDSINTIITDQQAHFIRGDNEH